MDNAANQLESSQNFTCMHCLAEYADPVDFFGHLHEEHFVHGGDQNPDLLTANNKQDCDSDSGTFLDQFVSRSITYFSFYKFTTFSFYFSCLETNTDTVLAIEGVSTLQLRENTSPAQKRRRLSSGSNHCVDNQLKLADPDVFQTDSSSSDDEPLKALLDKSNLRKGMFFPSDHFVQYL